MQKDLLDEGGGTYLNFFFLFPIRYIAEIVFLTHNYHQYLPNLKNTLGVNLRANQLSFPGKKISFSLQLLFKQFLWAILN